MLTNTDLEKLAGRMDIPLAYVGFKDELPRTIKPNKYYIINLEDAEMESGKQNTGSHWTGFQVNETGNGRKEAMYFDSFGSPPPKVVERAIKHSFGDDIKVNYPKKDIQSLVNQACGWYQLAFAHFINGPHSTKNLGHDTLNFLDFFEDLNKSTDFKKNEFVLKHFFLAKDPEMRKKQMKEINVMPDPETIDTEASMGGNGMKIPINVDYKTN
jgi:hypothetical protein